MTRAPVAFSHRKKDINLSVALRFGKLIESNCPDVKVIYTRKDDRFVTLHERAAIANRNKADLFISVHTNAVARGHTVQGFQVYTLGMHRAKDNLDVAMRENSVISLEKDYEQTYQGFDPKSSESYIMFEFIQSANMERSIELARFIQRSVCSNVGRNDKGGAPGWIPRAPRDVHAELPDRAGIHHHSGGRGLPQYGEGTDQHGGGVL